MIRFSKVYYDHNYSQTVFLAILLTMLEVEGPYMNALDPAMASLWSNRKAVCRVAKRTFSVP